MYKNFYEAIVLLPFHSLSFAVSPSLVADHNFINF